MKTRIFSSADQLENIQEVLYKYLRLPFSGVNVPGAVMEGVIADIRDAEILNTYDFVDVIDRSERIGWQVKSTKASTPVTWKRAKIPNADQLIDDSRDGREGLQALGDAIIDFCNQHALHSLDYYGLVEIGYARLIVHNDHRATYFERLLCTSERPNVFDPENYKWEWSKPKVTRKKEQLQALHGRNIHTAIKCWAWHGLGENQLHFSGEREWWPDQEDQHSITFQLPSEADALSIRELLQLLDG